MQGPVIEHKMWSNSAQHISAACITEAETAGRKCLWCEDEAYLHALPGQCGFQHVCGVLTNRLRVCEAFVPFDERAMVHTLLLQGEAEAEAHNRQLP